MHQKKYSNLTASLDEGQNKVTLSWTENNAQLRKYTLSVEEAKLLSSMLRQLFLLKNTSHVDADSFTLICKKEGEA